MVGGVISPRIEGTPQGGPLSPLLSNILLDDLDKELEGRGHKFCRYADDCNVYVGSKRAGQRVLASLTRYLRRSLRLRVNTEKSAVGRPWERTFLGYSMTSHRTPRLKAAPESIRRFRIKLKVLFRQARGMSVEEILERLVPILRGWINYFRLSEVRTVFCELDRWIRRHLRGVFWRQWKNRHTRAQQLMRRGIYERKAWLATYRNRGPWHHAGASHMSIALPNHFFEKCGLISLQKQIVIYSASS